MKQYKLVIIISIFIISACKKNDKASDTQHHSGLRDEITMFKAPNGWIIEQQYADVWRQYCDSIRNLIINDSSYIEQGYICIPVDTTKSDTLSKYMKWYYKEFYCTVDWNGTPRRGMGCEAGGKTCSKAFECLYCPNCK